MTVTTAAERMTSKQMVDFLKTQGKEYIKLTSMIRDECNAMLEASKMKDGKVAKKVSTAFARLNKKPVKMKVSLLYPENTKNVGPRSDSSKGATGFMVEVATGLTGTFNKNYTPLIVMTGYLESELANPEYNILINSSHHSVARVGFKELNAEKVMRALRKQALSQFFKRVVKDMK